MNFMNHDEFSNKIKESMNQVSGQDNRDLWNEIKSGINKQDQKEKKRMPFPAKMRIIAVASVAIVLAGSIGVLSLSLGGFRKESLSNIPPTGGAINTDKKNGVKDITEDIGDTGKDTDAPATDDYAVSAGGGTVSSPSYGSYDGGTEIKNGATAGTTSGYASKSSASRATAATKPDKSADVKSPVTSSVQIPQQSGILTAGEWNDNKNWDFWRGVLSGNQGWSQYQQNWGLTPTRRIAVTVTNGSKAVSNAVLVLENTQGGVIWKAVSDNTGKAYLFYSIFAGKADAPIKITVQADGKTASYNLDSKNPAASVNIELSGANSPARALDLMLVFDTTGSMSDELSYLQRELESVVTSVKRNNGNIKTRLSVNFYRDKGDDYVIRPFPFSEDIDTSVSNLMAQSANGGGDTPEAVEQALENAIKQHEWAANSTKLLFLILDAPPHNTAAITTKMHSLILDAAQKGIRVIPVASSGIDKETEFLLRSLSLTTGGTYVFLTNDSGVGGGHIEPTIGEFQVEKLNSLLIRIIGEYLK